MGLDGIDIHYQYGLKKTYLDSSSLHTLVPPFFSCAFGAQAKDIQLVTFLDVPILLHEPVLNSFQSGAVNLFEFTARQANQMIVVLMAVLVLEALRAVAEVHLPAHARFTHQLDRPRHRRITDTFVFSPHQVVQLLNGHVFLSTKKDLQHPLPLHGTSQPLAGRKLHEYFFCIHLITIINIGARYSPPDSVSKHFFTFSYI